MNNELKSWIISDQEYCPVLILLGEFGIYQSVFFNAYKHINKNTIHYLNKLPSLETINNHLEKKERIIVTCSSLEKLFRWSNLKNMPDEDVDDFCSKLYTVYLDEAFSDDEKLFDEMKELKNKYSGLTISAKSDNINYFLKTFNGPKYFINLLFDNYTEEKDSAVIVLKEFKYININLLIKNWRKYFGSDCPFSSVEIKRYVFPISKPTQFQAYIGGPKYRRLNQ